MLLSADIRVDLSARLIPPAVVFMWLMPPATVALLALLVLLALAEPGDERDEDEEHEDEEEAELADETDVENDKRPSLFFDEEINSFVATLLFKLPLII
jgi:hypothetical protein